MTREELRNHIKSYLDGENYDEACYTSKEDLELIIKALEQDQEQKPGKCKDCKYFEYNSFANCGGTPIIMAHEICSKWGNGCKTKENGYCFMYERKTESEELMNIGDDVTFAGVVQEMTDKWLLVRTVSGVEVWIRREDVKTWREN